jgi:hypothetical protein
MGGGAFIAMLVGRRLPKETACHSLYDAEAENTLPAPLAIFGPAPASLF